MRTLVHPLVWQRTASSVVAAPSRGLAGHELANSPSAATPSRFVPATLTIGAVDDPREREADVAAARVMGTADSDVQLTADGSLLRRDCACGATQGPCDCDPRDKEERTIRRRAESWAQSIATHRSRDRAAPAVATAVLGSAGVPLDRTDRAFFETRFGYDLSGVRVHADAGAARAAASVGAEAYTVGSHIVFGSGRFMPATYAGRHLLAHELAHVIQQRGGGHAMGRRPEDALRLSSSRGLLQRQCVPSPLPPASIPIGSYPPTPSLTERCLQNTYAETHPNSKQGISLGFNVNWMALTGKDLAERQALTCLKGGTTRKAGPHFTAKHGMYAGQPDIWDFANRTMYEITTLGQATFKSGQTGKLAAQIDLANAITGDPDCGGLMFSPGGWLPSPPTFRLTNGLYISVANANGVLIYTVVKDGSAELTTLVILAMIAAMLKKGGTGAAPAVAGKAAGRAVPVYAIASLVATAVLLASGKAEAKAGPGAGEPIVQLFEAMAQKGTPVPPEIQKMIQEDPELKDKINKAMEKGGDPTAAQNEINDKILKIMADNPDQFSKEDLEMLTTMTAAAGSALPKGQITVATTRKMLDKIKAGETGGEGEGKEKDKKSVWEKAREAAPPSKDAPTTGGGEGKANVWEKAKYPKLKDASVNKIGAAKTPVKKLFDAWVAKGRGGPQLTDAAVDQFFAIVPSDLTDEQAQALMTQVASSEGKTAEDVFASLKAAVEELKKTKAAQEEADAATGVLSIEPSKQPTGPTLPSSELIARLAKLAEKGDYSGIARGDSKVTWSSEKDNRISVTLRLVDPSGLRSAARADAVVVSRAPDGKTMTVRFTAATPFVAADGEIAQAATVLVGTTRTMTLIAKKP